MAALADVTGETRVRRRPPPARGPQGHSLSLCITGFTRSQKIFGANFRPSGFMNPESDTVPLRTEDGGGHGHKRRLLVYTDDNFLGCAGWGCCVLVSPASRPLRRPPRVKSARAGLLACQCVLRNTLAHQIGAGACAILSPVVTPCLPCLLAGRLHVLGSVRRFGSAEPPGAMAVARG